jgi:hypothetical protein
VHEFYDDFIAVNEDLVSLNLAGSLQLLGINTDQYIGFALRLDRQIRTNNETLQRMGFTAKDLDLGQKGLMDKAIGKLLEYKEGVDRNIAPTPAGKDRQDRWRSAGSCAATLSALRPKPRQRVKSARAALRPRGELKGRCIASKRFRHRAQSRGGARICGFTVASPCAGIAGALIAAPSTPPERLVCGKSRRQGRNIRHRPSARAPAL